MISNSRAIPRIADTNAEPSLTSPAVLIAGPTASGKSALALDIAARAPAVIINADALQVYANWDVLTARPPRADEANAPHDLYGHIAPNQDYSVGHWLREVSGALAQARENGQRPIIVGGTGLYFSALTTGLAEIPAIPKSVREEADALRDAQGAEGLLGDLKKLDPAILDRIDIANPMRLQRAWEVARATGKPLSAWQRDTPPPLLPIDACAALVLDADVDWLNDRIASRFAQMVDLGALDEVRRNIEAGLDFSSPAGQALGARQLRNHLQGRLTLESAIEDAAIATRQFAKRQRTWFRNRMKDWTRATIGPAEDASAIVATLKL